MTALSGQGHALGLTHAAIHANVVLPGQDSVSPAGMNFGEAVYCGYQGGAPGYRNGSYSNMSAIKARFPGARYVCVGTDAIDIEPGLASPSDAPGFVRSWRKDNTNKPVVYASRSQMGSVQSFLSGIPRSDYYLWVAEWNGGGIPSGYDAIQNGNTSGYDSDLFEDYMFGPAGPVQPPLPATVHAGSTGSAVVMLRIRLNLWGAGLPRDADGGSDIFGTAVLAAVEKFQREHKLTPDGTAGPLTWTALLAKPPVHVPVPVPGPPASAAPFAYPVLHQGGTGVTVAFLQVFLNHHGVSPRLVVSGVFDAETARDVRWFQGRHGLPETTVVDAKTWAFLVA